MSGPMTTADDDEDRQTPEVLHYTLVASAPSKTQVISQPVPWTLSKRTTVADIVSTEIIGQEIYEISRVFFQDEDDHCCVRWIYTVKRAIVAEKMPRREWEERREAALAKK